MKPLPSPDFHFLRAAQGWLELGNHAEANTELENISPKRRSHPDVLIVRWHVYANSKKWDACLDIASAFLASEPTKSFGWINRSFALRRLDRIQEAFDKLVVAAKEFPEEWQIPYNLACYSSLLGRFDESQTWFKKAILVEEKMVQRLGIDDPDLKPLWDSMSGTTWRRE